MKRKILVMAVMAMLVAVTAIAQPQKRTPKQQALRISKALEFNNRQTEEFTKVYLMYKDECQTVFKKYPRIKKMQSPDGKAVKNTKEKQPRILTDKEVENSILQGFKREKALIGIKEKYYFEFAKFMSPQQIKKMFMMENTIHSKKAQHKNKHTITHKGASPEKGSGSRLNNDPRKCPDMGKKSHPQRMK